MTHTITLTESQIQQLIWAVDIVENTLEGISDEELAVMQIDLNRKQLFAVAEVLENTIKEQVGA
jgi:uncharacterized protein (DUF433 family)